MGIDTLSIAATLIPVLMKGLIGIEKIGELPDGLTKEEVVKGIKQQDVSLQLAQQQARFAQELAIALRIETAEEVEIEEFYDNTGEGNAGLKSTGEDLLLGVSGSGRKITKRIYKFKGHNGDTIEVYQHKLNEVFASNVKTDDK